MAALMSAVGYLSDSTNHTVQERLRQVSGTAVVDMIAASEMMNSQAAGLIAAHNLVTQKRRLIASPAESAEIEPQIAEQTRAVQQATDALSRAMIQARKARKILRVGEPGSSASKGMSDRHKAMVQSLDRLETEFRAHQQLMQRFLALVDTDVDLANDFLEKDVQAHYGQGLMPAIASFRTSAENEFAGEIRAVDEVLAADTSRNHAAVLVALLVALTLGLGVSRSIGRPLTSVTRAAVDVGRGNLDARVVGGGPGELGTLVAAFNQMAENLQKSTISLGEKEVLLREVHHRVKNNLQIVCSLLAMQARETSDTQAAQLFGESQNRVRSMALIHECLYQSENLARINFAEYINRLIGFLRQSHFGTASASASPRDVRFHVDADATPVALEQAIPCGLIVNELASNALKHAFPSTGGDLWVEFHAANGSHRLTVRDNGVGFTLAELEKANSLGLKIVRALVTQLGGELQIDAAEGSRFVVEYSSNSS